MNIWLSAATLVLAAAASGDVKVPATTTAEIVPDGRIGGPEWSDAKRIALGEGVAVLIKADEENVAIAVKNAARGPHYTDLFLTASDGTVWNLHADANVGERKLEGATWSDSEPAYVWHNNATWSANAVEMRANADPSAPLAKQVKPYDGQEFLIARSQFPGKTWRLRVEVRDLAHVKPDLVYPAASDRHDTASWTVIALP
jgi:hypothetical protein